MPRMRMLKPDFFIDEHIGELPPLARLVLLGMWGIADKLGRLEDRPGRIRVQCAPFDDVTAGDIDEMLWLMAAHLITRYEVNGNKYIQLLGWDQKCHHREPDSTIPDVSEGALQLQGKVGARPVAAPTLPPPRPSHTDTESESDTDTESENECDALPRIAAVTDDGSKTNHVVEAAEDWAEAYGGVPAYGQIGKAMKRLVKLHPWAEVRPAWKRYLRETPAEFASPQKFAGTYGRWTGGAPQPRRAPPPTPKIPPAFLAAAFRGKP